MSEAHDLAIDPAAIEGVEHATAGPFNHDGGCRCRACGV